MSRNGIQDPTAAVVAEGACQGEVHHTFLEVHQGEEACQVWEVPACRAACLGACPGVEDRRGLPFREEGRASSAEDPSASVHKALTCRGEVQEVVALVEDLVHTLAEVLASSGQEDASLEVVHLAVPALAEVRIGLEEVDLGVSLREWEQEGECKSQDPLILEALAASYQEQDLPLLVQVLQVQVEAGSQVQ